MLILLDLINKLSNAGYETSRQKHNADLSKIYENCRCFWKIKDKTIYSGNHPFIVSDYDRIIFQVDSLDQNLIKIHDIDKQDTLYTYKFAIVNNFILYPEFECERYNSGNTGSSTFDVSERHTINYIQTTVG